MTTSAALILIAALALFTALSARGRAAAAGPDPWIAIAALIGIVCLHVFWLERAGDGLGPAFGRLNVAGMAGANTAAWLRLFAGLFVAHAGLAVLVVLASGWPRTRPGPAPAVARAPVAAPAVTFVKAFALVPALLVTIVAVLAGDQLPVGGTAPLLVLSGLAVIIAAGDSFELHHLRILGFAWGGLLVLPAIFIPVVIGLLPWVTGTELKVAQPATAMGRFFADNFARRTGHPLAVVSGDDQIAELVALAAPSRPSVYFADASAHSPWVTVQDIREKGAVIVWPALDTNPAPPPDIKAHFPDLVAEVPHTFARAVRGRLPPLLIGWGVIRPSGGPAATPRQ